MSITNNKTVAHNLDAFRDFFLTQLENPTLVDQIPDGTHIIILPHNDPSLLATNLKIAADIIQRMAVGDEPQSPVVLLSSTKTGEFVLVPIYEVLSPVG